MQKTIVILTKSSRHKQYCVVGYDIEDCKFVRLISSDSNSQGSIKESHLTYANGKIASILDIVNVEILNQKPTETHPEDILIDETKKWEYVGKFDLNDIPESIYCVDDFIYGNSSREITLEQTKELNKSIIIVKVKNLTLQSEENSHGKVKTRASFEYNSYTYRQFSVTDPDYYDISRVVYDSAILLISLPNDKWSYENNRFFKFIAKIFINES